MKKLKIILLTNILFFVWNIVFSQEIIYLSPLPDSRYNMEQTNIIIGYSDEISLSALNSIRIEIAGSKSGVLHGTILLVENNKKLIYIPEKQFSLGESVKVNINYPKKISYSFQIREKISPQVSTDNVLKVEFKDFHNSLNQNFSDDIPQLRIIQNGETAPGYIFIANFTQYFFNPTYLLVLNNNGTPYYVRQLVNRGFDFKKQKNGLLTFFDEKSHHYKALNQMNVIVDSFKCGNGYSTDFHELQVMEDGSAWLMSYDQQVIDMSQIVPGGDTAAIVVGLIIQKIDAQKNVVFQWRSWDHIPITEARYVNLLAHQIDYIHGNAIEVDYDGNIMISCRHTEAIYKINTNTGAIIWKLGGSDNDFTFINDSIGFSYQHDIRRLPNGNITLYDNGNNHVPQISRALEYSLDEVNKIATLVWEYRHTPNVYAYAMGNVQRLPNGNTLIGWGWDTLTLTEVTPQKEVVYELFLPQAQWSYRAFRFEWEQVVTGSEQKSNEIPLSFQLYQNFPNPFNPITTIKYDLPRDAFVKLVVYDILGREVEILVNNFQKAGSYSVSYNFSKLPSGVYFYRLTSNEFSDVKRMILIK
ncbi:MAG: aryl-sulfate sulfotransferase [Ignavibacteria bacterium]|nr:aryl-sulfate sulfotransferase [Ignavibacteria bacterium]